MARGKKRKGFNFNKEQDIIKKIKWLDLTYLNGDLTQSVYVTSRELLRDQLNSIRGISTKVIYI